MVESSYVHRGGKWPRITLYIIHLDNFIVRSASTWSKDSFVSIVCYLRLKCSQVFIWKLGHCHALKPFHFRIDDKLLDLPGIINFCCAIHVGCFPSIMTLCWSFSFDLVSFIFRWFVSIDYVFLILIFTSKKASWIGDWEISLNAADCDIVEELVDPLKLLNLVQRIEEWYCDHHYSVRFPDSFALSFRCGDLHSLLSTFELRLATPSLFALFVTHLIFINYYYFLNTFQKI